MINLLSNYCVVTKHSKDAKIKKRNVYFLIACGQALLFGQAKRVARERFRVSSRASTFHDIPKRGACSQANFLKGVALGE